MTVSFFVTHGRGLDVFAQEEIKEKVSNVCNVQTLGEGKISFSVPLKVSEPKMCSSEASEGDEEEEILVGAVSSVYNLKLVERIFILLHCEKFSLGKSCFSQVFPFIIQRLSYSIHRVLKYGYECEYRTYIEKVVRVIRFELYFF